MMEYLGDKVHDVIYDETVDFLRRILSGQLEKTLSFPRCLVQGVKNLEEIALYGIDYDDPIRKGIKEEYNFGLTALCAIADAVDKVRNEYTIAYIKKHADEPVPLEEEEA